MIKQSAAPYQSQAKNSGRICQRAATPAVAATAEKQELASSLLILPTATLAPIMSSHATSQTAATVATAPVLSQPLGTRMAAVPEPAHHPVH
jgi:flagellar hook-length control protein FliK